MIEPSTKKAPAMTVAYRQVRGSYAQMPLSIATLYHWVMGRNLQPLGMPMGVYLNDPRTVEESEALWEVWAPVGGEPAAAEPDAEGLGIKYVPVTTVASAIHRGTFETVASTYEALETWLAEEGFEQAGPLREAYMSDPEQVVPEDYLTEVQIPIRPAGPQQA